MNRTSSIPGTPRIVFNVVLIYSLGSVLVAVPLLVDLLNDQK
jgi:hypothetical protein